MGISNGLMLPHLCLAPWGQLPGFLGVCSLGNLPSAFTCKEHWASGEVSKISAHAIKSEEFVLFFFFFFEFWGLFQSCTGYFCNFDNHEMSKKKLTSYS